MIEGVSRVTLMTILIAVVVTALFHAVYAAVEIGKDLLLEFTFVAFLVACGIEAIVRIVRSRRQTKPPTSA